MWITNPPKSTNGLQIRWNRGKEIFLLDSLTPQLLEKTSQLSCKTLINFLCHKGKIHENKE
mgnify:CR=1 FL=1